MKPTPVLLALFSLALGQVSAMALPEPKYHVVSENEFGPLYSNVAPHERRDTRDVKYYPVNVNEHGIVYSSVNPDLAQRDDALTPLDLDAAAA